MTTQSAEAKKALPVSASRQPTVSSAMELRGRHFLTLMDYTRPELEALLDLAADMKAGRDKTRYLAEKFVGMVFSVPSTRTRVSFQVAAAQLGGHAEHLSSSDLQLANHESLVDTAEVLSRYLDALVVRMYDMDHYGAGRQSLVAIADHSRVPVINALDDKDHPCQVMADILTLKERFGGDYGNRVLLMSWGYSTRLKSPGVPHSALSAAALLGMRLRIAHPAGYELDPQYLEFARRTAVTSGAAIEFSNDLMEASEGVDAIYVKNWKSLTMSRDEDVQCRSRIRQDWCVSDDHFRSAAPGACYMDCMPFVRGEQVTAAVADGERSIIYEQAENRLHMQKAILAALV